MKILFFAPHAGIWVHAFPEALVAESLAKAGHEIVYVTCNSQFSDFCIPMSAALLRHGSSGADKEKVCRLCRRTAQLIVKQFDFRSRPLGDALTEEDRSEIANIVATANSDNFLAITIDGVDVGRLALYEMLLNHKKQTLQFSDSEWDEYKVQLHNALVSLFACRRILDEEKPDRLVTYNSLYGVNNVACQLAEGRGIPAYFLHAGGNISRRIETLLMGRGDGVQFYDRLLSFWLKVKDIPCSDRHLAPVTDHFLEVLKGRNVFVYSLPKANDHGGLSGRFGIPSGRRVLVATMSSPDERFAAETIGVMNPMRPGTFSNQGEWINALCDWVSRRPDLFLIIRVHPREFPNKREGVMSEHARKLAQAFAKVPENVYVNWPNDQVSLYDLAEIADVFLNAWSAAGKEMTLLGLPVVAFAPELLVYPPGLNYVAGTRPEYFEKIDEAIRDGWSIERTRATYRWCALEYERAALDIKENFPNNVAHTYRIGRRLTNSVCNRIDPLILRYVDCKRRQSLPSMVARTGKIMRTATDSIPDLDDYKNPGISIDSETKALRIEVKRLMAGLYGSAAPAEGSRLFRALSAFAMAGALEEAQ